MPRKTKAEREAELDARSLVGEKAIEEARKRWYEFGGEHSVRRCVFRFENVGFELERIEEKTDFYLGIKTCFDPKRIGGYVFWTEVVEMWDLSAFPSVETIRAKIEESSDLIRPEKIVAAYGRLLRCFLPVSIEEMHTETSAPGTFHGSVA